MISLTYDFHIHSCLSPCGDDDMTPGNIVGMASILGLDTIALTDHNSCRNCAAAIFHGETYGVTVIPGMELCTAEEVHVICLFPTLSAALAFDEYVYAHLLPIQNREDIFGKQLILDQEDKVVGSVENLLINATDISFDDCFSLVSSFQGLAFPSHIDKSSNSLLANLGFIPPDSTFSCAEVYNASALEQLKREHPYLNQCQVIHNSDAHYLTDLREINGELQVKSKNIPDILSALRRHG